VSAGARNEKEAENANHEKYRRVQQRTFHYWLPPVLIVRPQSPPDLAREDYVKQCGYRMNP
jgi:hypothetical protein